MKRLVILFLLGVGIGLASSCSFTTKVETSVVDNSQVFVSPSAGVAFHYVMESGRHTAEFIVGIIALLAFAGVLIALLTDNLPNEKWVRRLLGILAVIALAGLLRATLAVASDNTKPVSAATWAWYKSQPDGEKLFWDSIYQSNRMIGNSSK